MWYGLLWSIYTRGFNTGLNTMVNILQTTFSNPFFFKWKWLYFDSDWTDVYSLTPVDKSILVQVMFWHQTGDREEINFLLIVILLMWIQMLIIQAVYYDKSAIHFRDEYWLQILANGLCCFKTPLMQNAWGVSCNSTNHSTLLRGYSYMFSLQNICMIEIYQNILFLNTIISI